METLELFLGQNGGRQFHLHLVYLNTALKLYHLMRLPILISIIQKMVVEVIVLSLCFTPVTYLLRWGVLNGKMSQYKYQWARITKKCFKNELDLLKMIKQKSH